MLLRQSLKQTLTQKIDPKIILANSILACSNLELAEAIDQELAENPALERPDEDICAACNVPRELCIDCPYKRQQAKTETDETPEWQDWTNADFPVFSDYSASSDDDFDPMSNIGSHQTLHEYLLQQWRSISDEAQFPIGEFLIGCINESGYFDGDLEELSMNTAVSPEVLEDTLVKIQGFDPPGVGARSLQECLALQLKALIEQGDGNRLALVMVENFWADTATHKVARLAHLTKAPHKAVVAALDFIRDHLKPYPGEGFRLPWDTNPDNLQSVQPDIVVKRTVSGYEIEVLTGEQHTISISNKYREAYHSMRNGGAKLYSDEERRHISEYVERAEAFIRSIAQRRKTLRAITKYIIEFQQGYIETSQKAFLRPLTRTQVAKAIGVHESTVSRATTNKWIQLPSEEVVSYDLFFDGASSLKDLIGELISKEDKNNPLSDQEIAEILQERGHNIARRTVVKYREAQNILSSRRRRAS